MWPGPLGPSVELPAGPRNVSGVCRHGLGGGMWRFAVGAFGGSPYWTMKHVRSVPKLAAACRRTHSGLRRSSRWGREAREGGANIG